MKKFLAFLTAMVSVMSCTAFSVSAEENDILYGDANCDSNVNLVDLTCMNQHVVKIEQLSEQGIKNCDFFGDGEIAIKNLTMFKGYMIGLRDNLLPVENTTIQNNDFTGVYNAMVSEIYDYSSEKGGIRKIKSVEELATYLDEICGESVNVEENATISKTTTVEFEEPLPSPLGNDYTKEYYTNKYTEEFFADKMLLVECKESVGNSYVKGTKINSFKDGVFDLIVEYYYYGSLESNGTLAVVELSKERFEDYEFSGITLDFDLISTSDGCENYGSFFDENQCGFSFTDDGMLYESSQEQYSPDAFESYDDLYNYVMQYSEVENPEILQKYDEAFFEDNVVYAGVVCTTDTVDHEFYSLEYDRMVIELQLISYETDICALVPEFAFYSFSIPRHTYTGGGYKLVLGVGERVVELQRLLDENAGIYNTNYSMIFDYYNEETATPVCITSLLDLSKYLNNNVFADFYTYDFVIENIKRKYSYGFFDDYDLVIGLGKIPYDSYILDAIYSGDGQGNFAVDLYLNSKETPALTSSLFMYAVEKGKYTDKDLSLQVNIK